jgi:hypothetical protein
LKALLDIPYLTHVSHDFPHQSTKQPSEEATLTQLTSTTHSIPSSEANPCQTNESGKDCYIIGGSTPRTDDKFTTKSDISLPTEKFILPESEEESTLSTTQVAEQTQ